MALGRIGRALLALAFLCATQLALVHPYEHLEGRSPADSVAALGESHPFELLHAQQCDVCTTAAGMGGAACSLTAVQPAGNEAKPFRSDPQVRLAARAPPFRSQAPPAAS